MKEIKFVVEGMSCKHCKKAVEEAVNNLAGVEAVEVNLDAGLVVVTFDDSKSTQVDIRRAIEDAGSYRVKS